MNLLLFMEELLLLLLFPLPPLPPPLSFSLLLQTTELPLLPRLLPEEMLTVESILDAASISFSKVNRFSDMGTPKSLPFTSH